MADAFALADRLAIRTWLPVRDSPRLVRGTVEALNSREIVPNLLYDTRVPFLDMDGRSLQTIGDFCAGNADQLAATG